MGAVSVLGGLTGLRLPETLHHRLPQTLEEGELFGKDWTFQDCFRCIPVRPDNSRSSSYEDLSALNQSEIELQSGVSTVRSPSATEKTPLETAKSRRQSMKKLARQASVMDTQKTSNGAMQLTYWF